MSSFSKLVRAEAGTKWSTHTVDRTGTAMPVIGAERNQPIHPARGRER